MSSYREASTQELGPLIEDVRPRRAVAVASFGAMLMIGLMFDLGALLSQPRSFDAWLMIVVFGVGFPVIALLGLFGRKPDALRIHEHGFVVRGRPVRWDEVVELRTQRFIGGRRGRYRSILDRHSVRLRNGDALDLRFSFANNDAVLEHLRERTRDHLLREATAPHSFGPITLDDAGVRTDFARLSWAEISRAGFDGAIHNVVIRGPGSAWIEVPLREVPNAHVLCALVNARAAAGAS